VDGRETEGKMIAKIEALEKLWSEQRMELCKAIDRLSSLESRVEDLGDIVIRVHHESFTDLETAVKALESRLEALESLAGPIKDYRRNQDSDFERSHDLEYKLNETVRRLEALEGGHCPECQGRHRPFCPKCKPPSPPPKTKGARKVVGNERH
jgi:chromosome segregation ATPase